MADSPAREREQLADLLETLRNRAGEWRHTTHEFQPGEYSAGYHAAMRQAAAELETVLQAGGGDHEAIERR
jgi:hypothetical protein